MPLLNQLRSDLDALPECPLSPPHPSLTLHLKILCGLCSIIHPPSPLGHEPCHGPSLYPFHKVLSSWIIGYVSLSCPELLWHSLFSFAPPPFPLISLSILQWSRFHALRGFSPPSRSPTLPGLSPLSLAPPHSTWDVCICLLAAVPASVSLRWHWSIRLLPHWSCPRIVVTWSLPYP